MAKQKIHWGHNLSSGWFRFFFNIWGPFLGAGIRVTKVAADFSRFEVSLKRHWYNTNYVGTHFGGSLFAMTDPFSVVILLKKLGRDYIVWDMAASINFIKPGHGTVRTVIEFSEEELASIRASADSKEKHIFDKHVDVHNSEGIVIASVIRTLYVKRTKSP